jgi:ADP-L-glycero-D-manno-heptose 6-epimerase
MSGYTILTGGAGFIGSNILRGLNAQGISSVIVVDNLEKADKFRNLVGCEFVDYVDKRDFLTRLEAGEFGGVVDTVIHQGACSDTLASDGRYVMDNNYRYSMALLDFCLDEEVQFIYASSAAVYGGSAIFRESPEHERPLNVYGYSKFLFDQAVRRRLPEASTQIAGFRYFNVYGLNEDHKARMASVAWHFFNQYRRDGKVRLFEGSGGYGNGEQQRDFVSVEDVVKVNLDFLGHPERSGIFNLGTGRAQTFNEVAEAVINAQRRASGVELLSLQQMKAQGAIEYIAFPEALKGKYQHFTQADINALRESGYAGSFMPVSEGVSRYVAALLDRATS